MSIYGELHTYDDWCHIATETGNVSLLQWAHQQGGHLTPYILELALVCGKETGNDECYNYIMQNIDITHLFNQLSIGSQ